MTNQTIASKIVDLVKGIFGPKESATTAPEESKDAAATTEDAKTDEAKETTDTPTAEGSETDASDSGESGPATESADGDESAEPASPATEDKEAVAEELETAEAKTVSASRESMDSAAAAAEAVAEAPASDDLPVSNYDSVTIASMRARLRKLSLDDVRTLRAYEAANADRADFLKMYDNRIAKLEKEG